MNKEPSIILSGKVDRNNCERFLYLYELEADSENIIFGYKFSDWTCRSFSYYILHNNKVYFNREEPKLDESCEIPSWHRDHAWSSDEIFRAIQDYIVNNILLE